MIRLAWPDLGPEELAEVAEVLESGRLTMGPKVAELESELARVCGREYVVAVSSGTAALHLALLALGIGADDEVIVPAYTFPATANVVALAGARPVLVDVDAETMNIDPATVAAAVTSRTRAVMVVHLFGRPARWEEIREAVPEGVHLIEDAAGALGARRRGVPCGGLGEVACLSFHPRKIVTTGEGGAVVCADEELAKRVGTLRHHGQRTDGEFETPAFNYRLSDILAAVGLPQLRRLDELLETRTRLAAAYTERLRDRFEPPTADEGDVHGWQAYVVAADRRDQRLAALREAGIEAQIGTYALHLLPPYGDQGPFPGAEACYRTNLALPLHSRLAERDIERIAAALTRQ